MEIQSEDRNALRIIREDILGMSREELARNLDVSTQLVYTWERNKTEIPPRRLKQLEQISGIPSEYFEMKTLSDEKLKEIKQHRVDFEIYNNDTHDNFQEPGDTEVCIKKYARMDNMDCEANNLWKKIREVIYSFKKNGEYLGARESIRALSRFADVLKCAKQRQYVFQILRAMELFFAVDYDENRMRNSKKYEMSPLVQELLLVLQRHKEKEVEDLENKVRELQEQIKMLENK